MSNIIREKHRDYTIMPNIKKTKMDNIRKYGWKVIDKPGEFYLIPKKDLFVDQEYQRMKINEQRINKFASNWSWIKCGVLTIAIRNDQWYVVDGQHRKLAADKRSDIKHLPCMVFELNDISEEAEAFVSINSSKTNVSGYDNRKFNRYKYNSLFNDCMETI